MLLALLHIVYQFGAKACVGFFRSLINYMDTREFRSNSHHFPEAAKMEHARNKQPAFVHTDTWKVTRLPPSFSWNSSSVSPQPYHSAQRTIHISRASHIEISEVRHTLED